MSEIRYGLQIRVLLKFLYLNSKVSGTYILKKKRPYSYSRGIGLGFFLSIIKTQCKDLLRLKGSTDFLKLDHIVGESPTLLLRHDSRFFPAPRTGRLHGRQQGYQDEQGSVSAFKELTTSGNKQLYSRGFLLLIVYHKL